MKIFSDDLGKRKKKLFLYKGGLYNNFCSKGGVGGLRSMVPANETWGRVWKVGGWFFSRRAIK